MEKIKNPFGRILIHLTLILFAVYSIVPFMWTTLQSFKNLKDANSRTPKFIFSPTWENYTELWLRSVPENPATIAYVILAIVVLLICFMLFAQYIPIPNNIIYAGSALGFGLLFWGIPQYVDTCLLYTSPSPRDGLLSRMPSSA